MKKFAEIAKIIASVLAALFCLTKTQIVKDAVYDAVMRCLTVIIPSLYGMMIMSALLVKSGLIGKFPKAVTAPGRILFGMDGGIFSVFLFSMFAGYPVGAKMLCAEAESGCITRRNAEIFSGVCCGAGPAFIFGCISSQLYGSSSAGSLILISTVGANLLLAFILSFKMRKKSSGSSQGGSLKFSADILTESILSGGRSMADICIMITAFAVLTAFLNEMGIIALTAKALSYVLGISDEHCEGLLSVFLDVTAVNKLPHCNYTLLPAVCGLTAFGGVCVVMQIAALTAGKLDIKPFLLLRSAAAVISGIICRLLMPFMLASETVPAADMNVSFHSSASPVPSVLLIIMTVILFTEYEKITKRNKPCL